MPSPLPRWDRRWDRVAPLKPATAAFPIPLLGRLPHYLFRGLLGVHSRYGLPARGTAERSFASEASAVSLPPLPLRLLPAGATVAGWELHPLKIGALARRTKGTGKITPPTIFSVPSRGAHASDWQPRALAQRGIEVHDRFGRAILAPNQLPTGHRLPLSRPRPLLCFRIHHPSYL
jgi:hypothetical protein